MAELRDAYHDGSLQTPHLHPSPAETETTDVLVRKLTFGVLSSIATGN